MKEEDKISFLSEKIKELSKITSDIQTIFPEKSFKMDGILVGNIVEVMAAHAYGITLYKQAEKTHDGEVDGRKVQIKGTQGKNAIVIREEPEYLLVEYLDNLNGKIQEIYNGPGSLVWPYRSYVPSMNFYTLRVSKLLELDATVADEDRIIPIVPIEKYKNVIVNKKDVTFSSEVEQKKSGITLVVGYLNKNNQENMGCLNKPGNHYNQTAYLLQCKKCGFTYEANGCDIAIRKCPKCM